MGNHKKLILFGVGIAVGTIILVVAIIIGTLLPKLAQDQIEDALVVDKEEPNEKSFQHWVSNNYSEAAPYYKVFTFLNLTNYYEVQSSGAKPIYESVGPYYYRRYTTKLNYTFTEGGDKVAYSTYQPLYYEPDLGDSSLNPYSDVIYSINPTYVGLIVAARGESNLVQGMVAPTWKTVMSSVNSEAGYVGLVIDQYFIPYLLQNQQSLVAALGGDQAALDQFLSIWANDTTDPASPSGFNSTMRISVGGTSSDISLSSASLLFDMAQTLSLVSTNPAGFQTWFAAEQGDPTSIAGLQATFGLTSQQMSMILAWRGRFKPTYYNSLSAALGIANVTDLGYYQWGMGNLTAVDIATYMQAFVTLPETPEFAVWAAQYLPGDPVFSVDQSKQILAGEYSMLNTTNYITFITLLSQNNYGVIQARWGLTPTQAQYLYAYISAVIKDVYVVEATLQPAFAAGGGLIAYHTVDEWLWTCVDPLLEILLPSSPYCNLFHNDTSEAQELATAKASTYWTGKSDIDKIVEFIDYEGATTVDIWESPQPVGGTDASQFAPGVKKSDVLKSFVSDLARIVDLTFEKTVKVKGISLYRYVLADYMMDVDPVFYQSIAGFANMSSDNAGTPIFLSKPNFLDCDPYWQNQVEGVVPDSSYDTVIEVEPLTGVTMNAHKQLQLNVYYENSTSWTSLFSVFNPNMTSGLFYPVVWVDETSTLTDKQADDFKTAVLEPLRAFRITLIVGTIVGGLMAIAFAGVLIYFAKNQSSSQNVDVIDLAEPM